MRALIVGMDHYPGTAALDGCVEDAQRLGALLARHEDKSPNFDCRLVTSLADGPPVTAGRLRQEIETLFAEDAECALFYFAGHGAVREGASQGMLVTPEGFAESSGVGLDFLLAKAIDSHPNIKSSVIILDCCGAGAVGGTGWNADPDNPSTLGKGVTVLAAADRGQAAVEAGLPGGLFSQLIIDGLGGSAADLRGRITPAALYAHVDQMLGLWQQRPVYKANVKAFISLRQVAPRVDLETLRMLPVLFPEPDFAYPLSPECEPEPRNLPEKFHDVVPDPIQVDRFRRLQNCNRFGLVVPVGAEHMYYAAIESKHCALTELGKHYRTLAELGRI